jgi:hypothetical protein
MQRWYPTIGSEAAQAASRMMLKKSANKKRPLFGLSRLFG